jgi:hypothetical protein
MSAFDPTATSTLFRGAGFVPEIRGAMKQIVLAAALAILASVAHAQQGFVTIQPGPKPTAWWLGAEFNPMHEEIRGIPVAKIRRNWCKATEFSRDLIPKDLLVENGTDLMAYSKVTFSLDGNFDRTKTRQTALVGVYQTCAGKKGSFLLIFDQGTQKVRFVDTVSDKPHFVALSQVSAPAIAVFYCMECGNYATLRWNPAKNAFAWVK